MARLLLMVVVVLLAVVLQPTVGAKRYRYWPRGYRTNRVWYRRSMSDSCASFRCRPGSNCRAIQNTPVCCPTTCKKTYSPVCGSDMKSYESQCLMTQTMCETEHVITLKYKGRCKEPPKVFGIGGRTSLDLCNKPCRKDISLVCGNDGKTYLNKCNLVLAKCKQDGLDEDYKGPCKEETSCGGKSCDFGGQCVTSGDGVSACLCVKPCRENDAAVCGSDGNTYPSTCNLQMVSCFKQVNITVASTGPCKGIKRKRRKNQAFHPCASKKCKFGGKCVVKGGIATCDCSKTCPPDRMAVCGSDGMTYQNACHMKLMACRQQRKITVKSEGECHDQSGGQLTTRYSKNEICGSGVCGIGEHCVTEGGNPTCTCFESCPDDTEDVCGSDGVSYKNSCHLEKTACEKGTVLSVVYRGNCEDFPCRTVQCEHGSMCRLDKNGKPRCSCSSINCDDGFKPVCGSNGRVYSNECEMRKAGCLYKEALTVLHKGICGNPCYMQCQHGGGKCRVVDAATNQTTCDCPPCKQQASSGMVCGSNGVMYPSSCEMKLDACKKQQNIKKADKSVCGDPCASVTCDYPQECVVDVGNKASCGCLECFNIYRPVCGSSGSTYRSECHLRQEACQQNDRNLVVEYPGECKDSCAGVTCLQGGSCHVVKGRAVCECPTCPDTSESPICGSNLKTYPSSCHLRRDACLERKHITFLHQKACGSNCRSLKCEYGEKCVQVDYHTADCRCDDDCPKKREPVCGSNGETYHNQCFMMAEACKKKMIITAAHKGLC